MKAKKLLLLVVLVLPLVYLPNVQFALGNIFLDPGGGGEGEVYLQWVSKPDDITVDAGSSVSSTWKAKSTFANRQYVIKKNGVEVQSGTWISNYDITYTYTPTQGGTDILRCTVSDILDSLSDNCYLTVNCLDTDQDGVPDFKEQLLGTDLNDATDPVGQHFEDQNIGQNPNGWSVTENNDYNDIRIVDSDSLGLSSPYTGNILKIHKFDSLYVPEIYMDINKPLNDPFLISFDAGFYSKYDDYNDASYLEVVAGGMQVLKIEFKHDRVNVWEVSTFAQSVDMSFVEKKMYEYDLILLNDDNGYIDYSLYIDGEITYYGELIEASEIQCAFFGSYSNLETEFYLDNIFCDTATPLSYDNNVPFNQAIPLCWLFAPEVDGVMSAYEVGRTRTVEISIGLSLGIPFGKYFSLSVGIPIYKMYETLEDEHYGVMIGYEEPDSIIHIRYEYLFDMVSIAIPGSSEVYLDVLIDCEFSDSRYYDLTTTGFLNEYGWLPSDPRDSGITKIDEHTKTYEQDSGYLQEYPDSNGHALITYGGGFSIGKGLTVSVDFQYSEEVYAETSLWVHRGIEPQFDYGRPTDYYAYLGIQPYIVKVIGTM